MPRPAIFCIVVRAWPILSFLRGTAVAFAPHPQGALDRYMYRWTSADVPVPLVHVPQQLRASTTASADDSASTASPVHEYECSHCGAPFGTRNELFRHLRSDDGDGDRDGGGCRQKAGLAGGLDRLETVRVALLVGYDAAACNDARDAGGTCSSPSSVLFGNKIKEAFEQGMRSALGPVPEGVHDGGASIRIVGSSQSSIARARSGVLAQDPVCSAAGDVVVVNIKVPALLMEDCEACMEGAVDLANEYLRKELINDSADETAAIISFRMLQSSSAIHAEDDCSQRTYSYLLPITWLPGGQEVAEWWLETQEQSSRSFNPEMPPPQQTLQLIKKALRSAECRPYQNRRTRRRMRTRAAHDREVSTTRDIPNEMSRPKPSRSGAVSSKERRPWHNYSAPSLAGAASPNHSVCWKVLERARLGSILEHRGEVVLVVEFRADEFAQEQVRRMVGAAVAVAHGWLPDDFLPASTRSDAFVETPLAPADRLHLSNLRFQGRDGELVQWPGDAEAKRTEWIGSLRRRMLDRLSEGSVAATEACWLEELQTTVAPRIKEQLLRSSKVASTPSPNDKMRTNAQVPAEYEPTLTLLRDIVSSGRWPRTSRSRSKVIRQQAQVRSNAPPSGSFTVVNGSYDGGKLLDPSTAAGFDLPQGNRLFPELAAAVFELELTLAANDDGSSRKRTASSHCAVNCRASFTPHVDSGRGAGQTLSLIVGIGDYVGGELLVEGRPHDVCYAPLEFDGWRERHWTAPFEGERFSLVWFTPEMDLAGTTASY
mmetsp:Transcript_24736/g.71418  ORF Transcript_24736/g.71418 Transcript_24736/m.71418 type:complete len:771 (-) Transcript_24736:236-2548(-)